MNCEKSQKEVFIFPENSDKAGEVFATKYRRALMFLPIITG